MAENKVNRNYKDTVFRMLFQDRENLLSLYNAVNGTVYEDVDGLVITTLQDAVYMNYKNDVSFVFDFTLSIYEHQSTVNQNMPLRDLIYVSKVLQGQMKDQDIYSSRQIKLPTPKFVVFYNGTDEQPEKQTLRLSDAYKKQLEEVELELTVTVYNINYGHNQKLLEACQTLKEYAQYVAAVREYVKEMPLAEAVESAVDSCIRQGILADFLRKNRAEAIEMSIFEYDEEKHLKSEREIWLAEGIASEIVSMGLECGLSKEQILHRLQTKLNISEQTAKEYFDKYSKEPVRI
ncbi:hypothetical protein H8S17_01105 [Roseburia sp. BX1005]|uniref:Transposase (putative) YhgA-like domain-containing protein n=1 Tax=Roseburia zhanii TaxID=2763064 RepID=A0A923LLF1_9FIRM|nr:hypothetical protein [Roseburia zhanii]MBC5712818.1 hypothetical protein [Roseburia zhanii]